MAAETSFRSLSAAVATGVGLTWNPRYENREYATFQLTIATTATVNLEGRLAPDQPWVVIATYTVSTADRAAKFPEMRFNVTAWTSGAVTGDFYG